MAESTLDYSLQKQISDLNSKSVLISNQAFWNGCILTVWRNGNIVSARFTGSESAADTAGRKDSFLTIPEGSRPYTDISAIVSDQNNKRMILRVKSDGSIGLYYLIDDITSPTSIYAVFTWAAWN